MAYSGGAYSLIKQKARPVQSSIVLLSILGVSFLLFRDLIAHFISLSSASGANAFELPSKETPVSHGRKDSNEYRPGQVDTTQPRSRRIVIISTAVAISLRVLLSGLILDNGQCGFISVGVRHLLYENQRILTPTKGYLPLLLAIYDYWYIQRRRPKSEDLSRANGRTLRNFWSSIYLAAAYTVQVAVMGAPRSTYICPLSSSANTGVSFMQILSVLLDCYILIRISGVASTAKVEASKKSEIPSVVVGCIFLVNSRYYILCERCLMLNSHRLPPCCYSSAVSSHLVSIASTGRNCLASTGRIPAI